MKGYARITGCVCLSVVLWAPVARALPVSGRVVDFRAQPVAGAQVAVYERHRVADEDYGRLAGPIVHTNRRGFFSLEVDVSSQYATFIVARKEGLALTWDGLNYGGNTKGRGRFLLVMEKPAELAGTVVDSSGRPVAGAQVQAVPKTSYLRRLNQRPILAPAEWFTTRTDAAGRFRFGAFSADVSADFRVQATGWASTYEFTTHCQDCCGFEVGRTDIRLVLPPEGKVTGRVLDQETGRPARNVSLVIQPKRERPEDIDKLYLPNQTVSDANGCFVFPGVPQRIHRVEVLAPEDQPGDWVGSPVTVDVRAGSVTDNVTIPATKGGMIEITARGAYSGKPLRHVSIGATDTQRHSWQHGSTDAQGTARLRVLPGVYDIEVSGSGFHSWRPDGPLSVATGQTVRVDARLSPGDRVAGTARTPDGAPVPRVSVKLHPFGDEAYTDQTGGFTIGCDPHGRAEGGWLLAVDERQSRAALVQATEKGQPVELVLQPALHVTGLVADANGVPIPAARIALHVRALNYLSDLGPETLTDSDGRFRLLVVPPPEGAFEYAVSVHATDYGPRLDERMAIRGAPGATCDLGTITLPTADQSLAGVVVDCDGLPAPGIPIFLHGRRPVAQPDKSTATDAQGRFRVTRLCRGTLSVQANFDSSPGGSSTITAEGGQQNLRIVLPGHLSTYASLVGKPLPDLREIVFPAAPPETDNRPMLICFFDMEQRPSRRGLAELTKQADDLRQKDISVLAVHIRRADEESLKRWAGAQNTPFPVGMIKEDAARVRFAWGVQSLPWLVLADAQHIVCAEGFDVGDLERRIEGMEK
jgi:protocatechuate 3,4-dioxygenase beta subunit